MIYLAKSDGTTLQDHSKLTEDRCAAIATDLIADEVSIAGVSREQIIEACRIAGRYHDIGKALPYFQTYLAKTMDNTDDPTSDMVDGSNEAGAEVTALRFHNEYSWLTLALIPSILDEYGFPPVLREAILNAVYWHHGAAQDFDDSPSLLNAKDEGGNFIFSFEPICDYLGIPVPEPESYAEQVVPSYASINERHTTLTRHTVELVELNALIAFVRMVLIRGDREASGRRYANESHYKIVSAEHLAVPESYKARFATQKTIIAAANRVTNMLAAPAGFGKTLVGMAWALQYGRPVMWVCPRNVVIDAVYDGLKDLDRLMSLNLHVSKVYGGNETSFGTASTKSPRIIVTNIDAITQPMASQRLADVQYEMFRAVMVFDEYHEIPQDMSAMYAAYSMLAYARGAITKAPQMFLSATPVKLEKQHSLDPSTVAVLPGENQHFAPQHDKVYHVYVVSEMPDRKDNQIRIFNVVDDAQKYCDIEASDVCIHSKYTAEDRADKMGKIYASYGKGATGDKFAVCSGPILRASADISFRSMAIMCSSPNNDIQCIGRCDRFGEYDEAELYLVVPDNINSMKQKANKTYIEKQYDLHLYGLWTEFVKKHFHGDMTLTQIYALLDQFNKETAIQQQKYADRLFRNGVQVLAEKCHPRRPSYNTKTTFSKTAHGTIRNPDPSMKYIVLGENQDEWYGPFSVGESEMDMDRVENLYKAFAYRWSQDELKSVVAKYGASLRSKFPKLADYLGEPGKKGENKRKKYLLNKSFYRNDNYPYIVHPSELLYSHDIGIFKNKSKD